MPPKRGLIAITPPTFDLTRFLFSVYHLCIIFNIPTRGQKAREILLIDPCAERERRGGGGARREEEGGGGGVHSSGGRWKSYKPLDPRIDAWETITTSTSL